MFKNVMLVAALAVGSMSFSQEGFRATEHIVTEGPYRTLGKWLTIEESLVTEVEGKTAQEIYDSAVKFIKMNFKSPDDVILSKIEGEYIRFEGISRDKLKIDVWGKDYSFDIKYNIIIRFKDGRFKTDISKLETYTPPSKHIVGGWSERSFAFKITDKKGKAKKDGIHSYNLIRNTFNDIVFGIKDQCMSNELAGFNGW